MSALSEESLKRVRDSNELVREVFAKETDKFSNKIARLLEEIDRDKKAPSFDISLPKLR